MATLKQSKIFVGALVAGIAALTVIVGSVMAQDSGESSGCECCENMGQMNRPSDSTGQ
ncbi:MAG: hypothetical protein KME47_25885 [Nodosilinea sp. WJT8-NPBG4]|jgi:hypothetical protein|nr:hypothetical protein [Nodosilinea sp. WJT8-NPBG4]